MIGGFKPSKGPKITFQVWIEKPAEKKLSEPEERAQEFKSGENVPSSRSARKSS